MHFVLILSIHGLALLRLWSNVQAHQDGPAYFPVVAILSLGSPVVMDFTPHSRFRLDTTNTSTVNVKEKSLDEGALETGKDSSNYHPFSVLLMPRSLLIFKDAAYSGSVV